MKKYVEWEANLQTADAPTTHELIGRMVTLLNEYKSYIDLDLVFDSSDDFLYRQKGQMKLDNTVLEEFLPVLVRKCLIKEFGRCEADISAQTAAFSSAYFTSALGSPAAGGGLSIKTKDQDFCISKPLYLKSSCTSTFEPDDTVTVTTNLGYVTAELKTNLDKTMYQEAAATAHDVKLAVPGARYYLLCDFLDMTPISTATTDIDEILILRKAKRISSDVRRQFGTFAGRQAKRTWYWQYLSDHPYRTDVFERFVSHIAALMRNETLVEENVLDAGYF